MAALDGDVLIHKYELFNDMAVALAELQAGLRDRMTSKDILEMILEAETVDPVEPVTHETALDFLLWEGWMQEHDRILTESAVKHGRWEDCSNGWMCSVCKHDARKDYPYCPYCGAKMDEEG